MVLLPLPPEWWIAGLYHYFSFFSKFLHLNSGYKRDPKGLRKVLFRSHTLRHILMVAGMRESSEEDRLAINSPGCSGKNIPDKDEVVAPISPIWKGEASGCWDWSSLWVWTMPCSPPGYVVISRTKPIQATLSRRTAGGRVGSRILSVTFCTRCGPLWPWKGLCLGTLNVVGRIVWKQTLLEWPVFLASSRLDRAPFQWR